MVETVKVALSDNAGPAQKPAEGDGKEVAEQQKPVAQQQEQVKEGQEGDKPADQQEAPKNPAEALKETPEGAKPVAQQEAEQATGLDLGKFSDEVISTGKLSDESYKELEGKGYGRPFVDTYIAGLQAQQTARLTALSEAVGGVDNYNALITWGGASLSNEEKATAVAMLSGKDVEAAKTYLVGLNTRFVKENGKAPGKTSGGGGASPEKVFKSRSEQAAAMRDPRYHTDAKYRAEVTEMSIRSFSSKSAKKRSKPSTKKTASKNTHRRARAKGRR